MRDGPRARSFTLILDLSETVSTGSALLVYNILISKGGWPYRAVELSRVHSTLFRLFSYPVAGPKSWHA